MKINGKVKGYFYGIVAAVSYGLNPLFALPMYNNGLDPDSVLICRYGFSVIFLGILLKVCGVPLKVKKEQVLPLVSLGISMAGSSLFLFLSYQKMDAGIASSILFVYPVLVALFMSLFFGEKLSVFVIISLILSFVGINLLYKSDGSPVDILGVVYVILSAVCYAFYLICVKVTKVKGMRADKMTFYSVLFGLFVFIIRLRGGIDFIIPPNSLTWSCGIGSALVCTVISLITTSAGINLVGPTPVAILGALEPVTAVVVNVILFDGVLTGRMIFGIVLIILSASVIICIRQIERLTRYKKLCQHRRKKVL
ncbi:MAG: DMT family transporter [Alphaproteobacteria bacterium]|nr:DMT family transporter [Alphaproteobacteria bacterium]